MIVPGPLGRGQIIIISLPFKLIFFVLVDGWRLISGSLVESYLHGPPPN